MKFLAQQLLIKVKHWLFMSNIFFLIGYNYQMKVIVKETI